LNKAQIEIQNAARDFAKGEFDKELAEELDKQQAFPDKIWKKASSLGFVGMNIPEAYGGDGLDVIDRVLLAEALCRRDSTLGSALMLADFSAVCLQQPGSEKLKKKYLSKIVQGKMLSGAAIEEKDGGYRLDALATTAEKDGGDWVINGEKSHVINGGKAGFYCVLCRTGETGSGQSSMFVVDAKFAGLSVVDEGERLGLRMTPATGLVFDNVKFSEEHLIGKEGEGLKTARALHEDGRMMIAALALGTAQGAFDRALAYVKQREQFGRKIGQFQITRHKLAGMASDIIRARHMTYAAAGGIDRGKTDPAMICMAKLSAAHTAIDVASEAIQLLGGYGYMKEYEIERFYRDAKTMSLMLDNETLLKDEIADAVIGRIK